MKYLYTCLVVFCCTITTAFAQPAFTITPSTTAAVDPGENINFDVTVTGFTEIISVQFDIVWDANVLNFVSIDETNGTDFPGLSASNISSPSPLGPGSLRISWLENSLTPVSVDDGALIFSFTLASVGGGTTSVAIDATLTEVIDANESNIGLSSEDTSVQVTGDAAATCTDGIQNQGEEGVDCGGPCAACPSCNDGIQNGDETGVDCGGSCSPCDTSGGGGGGGGGGGSTDFGLTVAGATVEPGSEVCLDVTADNFADLISMQFSMSWDVNALSFTRTENITTGLSAFNENSFGLTETDQGRLLVSWNAEDPSVGTTLPNGSVLFQVCFNALGGNGTNTMVNFSNTPLEIEISDVNGNFLDVDVTGANVNIQGEVDPPADCPSDAAPFCIANTSGAVNTMVCVPVSAQNFDNILSFQHSITFNTSNLDFQSINITGDLVGLAQSNFNTGSAETGSINVSWLDNDVVGLSLDNGTVLYEMCFNVLSEGTHLISFSQNPTPFEIFNGDTEELAFNGADGSIEGTSGSGGGCAGEPALSVTGMTTDVSCRGEATGSIDLTVTGGGEEYMYAWSDMNGTAVQDLMNVSAGTYTVTVNSRCASLSETMTFTINEPATGIDLVAAVTQDVQCFGEMTGAIEAQASGGTGTLAFAWTGAGTQAGMATQSGLATGTYTVTVTDEDNCSVEETLNVGGPESALAAAPMVQPAGCGGEATGMIDLNITGGTAPYTVEWMDGPMGVMRTGLVMGDYIPTSVMDANGCTLVIGTQTVGGSDTSISIASEVTAVTMDADGAIDITITGGTAPFTYVWTNPNNEAVADTEDLNNISEVGIYTFTVTDASGCEETEQFSVGQPIVLNAEITPACGEDGLGSVMVLVSGGVIGYRYAWTNEDGDTVGNGEAILSDVLAGTYTVTVTDGANAQQIGMFTVETAPGILIEETVTNETVSGINDNGAIDLVVSGGSGTFQYAWSDATFGDTPSVMNLDEGAYTVTVTDDNDCIEIETYEVEYLPSTPAPGNYMATDASCAGIQDGALSFSITNGDPGYVVTLSGGGIEEE
ncbi:MAG: cohesin domain-containing protein, partial [Bacteroidota bacterium]